MPSLVNATPAILYKQFCANEISLEAFLSQAYEFTKTDDDSYVPPLTDLATSPIESSTLKLVMNDASQTTECRVMAFYALCTRYRRQREYTQLKNLIKQTEVPFKNEPLYNLEKMVSLKSGAEDKDADYPKALSIWDDLDESLKLQPAAIQAYADTVALCFESLVFSIDNESEKKQGQDAIELIKDALQRQNRPKLHATMARLYSAFGENDKARRCILRAIDQEDSTIPDYALRLMEYQTILDRIETDIRYEDKMAALENQQKELEKTREKLDQLQQDMEKTKYDSLAFLGFFAALLALIMGTYSITPSASNFTEVIQVILTLAGSIIVSFAALSVLLPPRSLRSTVVMAIMGVALVAVALFVIPLVVH